tara:strand:+ start:214 stop:390 length:177 start_codon:yes stop_codon:yes gene_type:complete
MEDTKSRVMLVAHILIGIKMVRLRQKKIIKSANLQKSMKIALGAIDMESGLSGMMMVK